VTNQMVARVRDDRLLRWSAYAAVPVLWLALALVNPLLLLFPPLVTLLLWTLMRYGIIDRADPVVEEDPDFF
jgi:hypothetical protein